MLKPISSKFEDARTPRQLSLEFDDSRLSKPLNFGFQDASMSKQLTFESEAASPIMALTTQCNSQNQFKRWHIHLLLEYWHTSKIPNHEASKLSKL